MGKSGGNAGGTGQDQGTGEAVKRIKVYYGMIDKEKMELMNLRKRVKEQREEIKKLQEIISQLKMEKHEDGSSQS